ASGQVLQELDAPIDDRLVYPAMSDNGDILCYLGRGVLWVYRGPDWLHKEQIPIPESRSSFGVTVFSRDGKLMALGLLKSIRILETTTWRRVGPEIQTGGEFISNMQFTPDNGRLLVGPTVWAGGSLRIYDVASGQPLHQGIPHAPTSQFFCLDPSGRYLA